MSLFKPAKNMQGYAKIGILGFAGSGKTFTATSFAIGLATLGGEKKPVYFLDTETGSDWVIKRLEESGIPFYQAKTRAFADLLTAIKEAQEAGAIIIIDSITHFWRELCTSYAKKRGRTNGLQFQDWGYLKEKWGEFTDLFVNSRCHIIMCGRAGYEYDFFQNEDGKRELEKTGIKMKTETETGYEPSLLVLMERETDMETKKAYRMAYVLKDRSAKLDGREFKNPKFSDFKAHVDFLNVDGEHVGVDTRRNSESIIDANGKPDWKYESEQKIIALDEIETLLVEHYPGQTKEEKAKKIALLKEAFETAAWERIKTYPLVTLRAGFNHLKSTLEPVLDPPHYENGEDEDLPGGLPAGTYPAVGNAFVQGVLGPDAVNESGEDIS